MADKIDKKSMIGFRKDVILIQSANKPHKSLMLHFYVEEMNISGLAHKMSFRVIDSLGKIRFSGDHIVFAIEAYNKLYNEDNSR
jgi:hypothetical protein